MLAFFQNYTKTPSNRIEKKGSLLLIIYFPDYSTQWILIPCNQHLELGFDLTEFHEFCCLSVSAGGYQEIRKKGPHVGIT